MLAGGAPGAAAEEGEGGRGENLAISLASDASASDLERRLGKSARPGGGRSSLPELGHRFHETFAPLYRIHTMERTPR